jgi:Transposase DDE domain
VHFFKLRSAVRGQRIEAVRSPRRRFRRSSFREAYRHGCATGPSPVDRRRAGSKHHVICDGQGIPLAVTLTAGNRNDITELLPLVDRVPPTGRYRKFRPKTLLADRA